jgi:hypothetical protein
LWYPKFCPHINIAFLKLSSASHRSPTGNWNGGKLMERKEEEVKVSQGFLTTS